MSLYPYLPCLYTFLSKSVNQDQTALKDQSDQMLHYLLYCKHVLEPQPSNWTCSLIQTQSAGLVHSSSASLLGLFTDHKAVNQLVHSLPASLLGCLLIKFTGFVHSSLGSLLDLFTHQKAVIWTFTHYKAVNWTCALVTSHITGLVHSSQKTVIWTYLLITRQSNGLIHLSPANLLGLFTHHKTVNWTCTLYQTVNWTCSLITRQSTGLIHSSSASLLGLLSHNKAVNWTYSSPLIYRAFSLITRISTRLVHAS